MAQNQPRNPENPYPQQHYQHPSSSQHRTPAQGQTPQQHPPVPGQTPQRQSYPPSPFHHDNANNHGPPRVSNQTYQNYGNQNPRATPMRLDLPPPPVFTTAASPNTDFPTQYGPPSGLPYSPMDQLSPSILHPPHTNPSPMYSTPYAQNHSGGYAPSLPTSPYPLEATPGYGHPQQYMQHPPQPQQSFQQQPQYVPQGGPGQHDPPQLSPYYTPSHQPHLVTSSSSNGSGQMNEYFPPYNPQSTPFQQTQQLHPPQRQISSPTPSPTYPPISDNQSTVRPDLNPAAGPSQAVGPSAALPTATSGSSNSGPKTSRQQFSACGACRHRRVKCDLKDRQEEAERAEAATRGVGPARRKNKKVVYCTNCVERGMKCVDEFAPIKAAKQLRRGKRISEIENLYGKNAVTTTSGLPAKDTVTEQMIPELTPEFFESPFFRRFQVQRPILDPTDFVGRYLSFDEPCAANLGPEGAILCHVLYAWAVSYGVDEHGQLDIPEGGSVPLTHISLIEPGKEEIQREEERNIRFGKMRWVINIILEEIDACGILRKPTWDGSRVLLLILPLTEGISTPVERLAMYESALSQVFMLCSYGAIGYDGQAAGTSGVNGGTDEGNGRDLNIVRIRTYWYAFVHEGITTGLKGGRLLLDGDDFETIRDSMTSRTLVSSSQTYQSASKMAVAPINLALACRLIHRALTGPTAKRRHVVNAAHVKDAWEALEKCWETFESFRDISPGQYSSRDEIIRFVDGWKIFLFEAQNVIRSNLEERLTNLTNTVATASITDTSGGQSEQETLDIQILNVAHLLEIAKDKCDAQTKAIMTIVRQHIGTRFFEWDASLVRDGTYYAALLLAKRNGSDEDVACCIQALNEFRWAHGKAWARSADLRREWAIRSAHSSIEQSINGWDGPALQMGVGSMYHNPVGQFPDIASGQITNTNSISITTHITQTNSLGTGSSHSNSPYTSASSLVSPIYDPSGGGLKMAALGPLAAQQAQPQGRDGQWNQNPIQSMGPPSSTIGLSTYNQEGFFDHSQSLTHSHTQQHSQSQDRYQHQQLQQQQHPMMSYQEMQDLGLLSQDQGQGQGAPPTGRYVFQPDGTQVYMPYNQE